MKKFAATHSFVLLASLTLFFGAGCGSSTETTAADQPPELSIQITQLEYTATDLTASAERGKSRVTIFIHRGEPRIKGFIRDPEIDSPYESDLAVRNRYGYPFLTAFGGDIPTSSAIALEATKPPQKEPVYEEQMEDLQLAIDAVEILLHRPDVGEQFRWELRDVSNMAKDTRNRATEARRGALIPTLVPEVVQEAGPDGTNQQPIASSEEAEALGLRFASSKGTQAQAASSSFYHSASIRWANCCINFGQHSAVLLDIFTSSWVYSSSVVTGNHGRQATDPSMVSTSGCPKTWGLRTNYLPPLQPYGATDLFQQGDAGGCGSPYDAIFPTAGGHVCNDDSLAEYWHVKNNAAGSWATCGDSTLRSVAPSCD